MCNSVLDEIFQEDFIETDREKVVGNYKLGRLIDSGKYSEVRIGSHLITGSKVAVKCIKRLGVTRSNRQKKIFKSEVKSLKKLRHTNIIFLYETMVTDKHMYLVLEYIDGKTLKHFIKERAPCKEDNITTKHLVYQLVEGISYCHANGILHRDLKPSNIMVTKGFCVFIIDFGLSCCVEDAAHIDHSCGTPAYCSPEVYSGEISSYPRDVWALGVILFELVTGSSPFYDGNTKNKKDIFTNIIKKLILPDSITLECQDLLKHMLIQDPDKRITAKNILQHDWFKEVASAETLSGVQEFHVNPDTCDIVGRHYGMSSADTEACLSEDARNTCTTYYHLLFKKHQNP